MRDMYMRSGQGFLLIYDVTNRASFLEMPVFRNQILSAKDADNVPLVIVGNKCDLEDARDVSTADGVALANSYGAEFFEGSAKSRKNVDEAFFALVRACGCSAFSFVLFLARSRARFRFVKYASTSSEKQRQQRQESRQQANPPPPSLPRRSFAHFYDLEATENHDILFKAIGMACVINVKGHVSLVKRT